MKKQIEEILNTAGFKKTTLRTSILELFISSNRALSSKEIEGMLPQKPDRVTLFRILKDFEGKCIIHKITEPNGSTLFAFCVHTGHNNAIHNQHLHFTCTICNSTYCINDVNLPLIKIPKGYKITEWNMSAKGICSACNK
jgi:Fur family ferric uptake transcriptional regulator